MSNCYELKSISKAELEKVLQLHEMWVRGEYGGKRADLSYTDLDYADLSICDLRGANFEGSSLAGSNFNHGFFVGANFSGACLDGASMNFAIMSRCNFDGASLDEVSAIRTNFSNSTFGGEGFSMSFDSDMPDDSEPDFRGTDFDRKPDLYDKLRYGRLCGMDDRLAGFLDALEECEPVYDVQDGVTVIIRVEFPQ